MPEQLALDQRLGDRAAVERDEGALGAARAAVDLAGEHLLARAGLAQQQHVDVAGGDLVHHPVESGHLVVVDDEALRRRGALLGAGGEQLVGAAAVAARAAEARAHPRPGGDEGGREALHQALRVVGGAAAGEHLELAGAEAGHLVVLAQLLGEHVVGGAGRRLDLEADHREGRARLAEQLDEAGVGLQRPRADLTGQLVGLEDGERLAQLDAVAGAELDRLVGRQLSPAHGGAVGAAEIFQHHPLAQVQRGVPARGGEIIEPNGAVVAAADGDVAVRRQRVRRGALLGDDHQAPPAREPGRLVGEANGLEL